jgi:hypothetical protein
MRIDASAPFYTQNPESGHFKAPAAQTAQAPQKQSSPGVIVDISKISDSKSISKITEYQGCETCKSRRYQDKSNDPSVSFQSPTRISPNAAASAVASHEREHVAHETAKAEKEGREIINQSVTIKTGICPECKRVYVSGGVTRTTSAPENNEQQEPGQLVDLEA